MFSTTERLVKIADFGLARLGDDGTAGGLTVDGAVMGTPDYIAPEQARSATAADIRSDLYSLGCTLYHFLTGHTPFAADTAVGKMVAHASEEPSPLGDSCPGLSPTLAAVVTKLMAKDPADRYQTPVEVADALSPFCPKPRASAANLPTTAPLSPAPPTTRTHPPAPASRPGAPPASTVGGASRPTPPPLPPQPAPLALDPDPEPEPKPAPRHQGGPRRGLVFAGGGLCGVAALAAVLVPLFSKKPEVVNNVTANPNIIVNTPVNVTVKIDDWPKAREPGVVIYLVGGSLTVAEREKVRTIDELKQLALLPGNYTVVLKKDGKELEARTFDVTPTSADKEVVTRPASVSDPAGDTSFVRQWGAAGVVTDLIALPDGQRFVSLAGGDPKAGAEARAVVAVYHMEEGTTTARWEGSSMPRMAVVARQQVGLTISFSEAFGGTSFTARAVSLETGDVVSTDATIPSSKATGVRAVVCVGSPDGQRLLWWAGTGDEATKDKDITLYTVTALTGGFGSTPDRVSSVRLREKTRYSGSTACFDPSGNRVLVARDRSVALCSEDDGKRVGPQYGGPTAAVFCVAVAPDGKRFAAGCTDGTVFMWNTGASNPAAIGKGHAGKVNAVGFGSDGARAVSAGEDGTVRVWNAADGKEVGQFKHDGPVYALAMIPDGKRVLSGGADKTIRLWQLPP